MQLKKDIQRKPLKYPLNAEVKQSDGQPEKKIISKTYNRVNLLEDNEDSIIDVSKKNPSSISYLQNQ
jgi:hypothetical protein